MVTQNAVDGARKISRNVILLQFLWGCSYGCYIFIYGVSFARQFSGSDGSFAKGLTLTAAFLILRQVLSALLDIPLGVLADRFGRLALVRFAFLAKLMFHGSLAFLALGPRWFPGMLAAVSSCVFFAMAYTSFSGAFSAWVVSELREGGIDDPSTVLAGGHNAFFAGELLTGVVSVFLFTRTGTQHASYLLGAGLCAIAWTWAVIKCRESREVGPFQLNTFGRVPEMARRFRERFQVLRTVVGPGRIVLAVMMMYGCFLFLLNFVELYWPALLDHYNGGRIKQVQIWLAFVPLVCIIRLTGSRLFRHRLKIVKSISIELKPNRVQRLFLFSVLIAAAVAIVGGISAHLGSNSNQPQAEVTAVYLFFSLFVVLVLIFIHGFIAPLYDVLVNAIMPASLDSYRAAVLSIGTTVRSALVAVFAGPAAAAITHWGWAVPGAILLITILGANVARERQRSGIVTVQSK